MSAPRHVLWRILIRAYPPGFRRRYGPELGAAVDTALSRAARGGVPAWHARLRLAGDLIGGAAMEWLAAALHTESPVESIATMLHRLLQDLRLALRRLAHAPGFTAVAVLSVAIGIGANTAIFTLVDGVLLRPLPYRSPERLVFLWSGLDWIGVPRAWIAGPHVPLLRQRADLFEGFAAIDMESATLAPESDGDGRRIQVARTQAALFPLLGVDAARGRVLLPEEDGPGAPRVVVLTHALWQSALGGDPDVVGRDVPLEGEPHRVVGVMPPEFRFDVHSSLGDPTRPAAFVPLSDDLASGSPDSFGLALLGRIADGVEWSEARAQLDAIAAEYGETTYRRDDFRFRMVPVHGDLVGDVRPALLTLMGAVGLVLAIVCSNLALLFLGRSLAGRRDLAVRAALGAGRWGRFSLLFVESLLVAGAGGILGYGLAHAGTGTLLALGPSRLPRAESVSPDLRVMLFGLVVVGVVALAAGLLPALRQGRLDVAETLRQGGRSGSTGDRGLQRWLVVGQVALSGVLLLGAGLMGRSLVQLLHVDPGFGAGDALTVRVRVPDYLVPEDDAAVDVFRQIRDRVLARTEAATAGWIDSPPLSAGASQSPYSLAGTPGATGDPESDRVLVDALAVSPGAFESLDIEILAGRDFTAADDADGEPVAIVDETLVRRFWPDGGAVGSTILHPGSGTAVRVVGVVRHARQYDIRRDDRAQVYRPHAQWPYRTMTLVATADDGPPEALAGPVRAAVADVDPRITVDAARPMSAVVSDALSSWRFLLQLLSAFATTALGLGALGVYGVLSVAVTRRTREIGIRMALGARAVEVGRGVILEGLRLAAVGILLALGASLLGGSLLEGFLYGVRPWDPASLAGVALGLAAVALVAAWIPARRATRVAPVEAFKAE